MENREVRIRTLDKESLNERYEDLRAEALDPCVRDYQKSQGLALFTRQGMVVWCEAWSKYACCDFQPSEEKSVYVQKNLPVDLHSQVAVLLTNMALDACGR